MNNAGMSKREQILFFFFVSLSDLCYQCNFNQITFESVPSSSLIFWKSLRSIGIILFKSLVEFIGEAI